MIAVPPSAPSLGAYAVLNRSISPDADALGLSPPDGCVDADAGGAALVGAAVVDGLPPHAAATSTAALAPISNRRRVPPERFVIVCSSCVGHARAGPWMAEAVDRGSAVDPA